MGNKGAFITMGTDLKPNYTTYDAVVSLIFFSILIVENTLCILLHPCQNIFKITYYPSGRGGLIAYFQSEKLGREWVRGQLWDRL